jgi:pre-mRNA-splicing helicase BRR2
LRSVPASGLFFFDSSFRPVPLSQQFIGVKSPNAMKRLAIMNDVAYKKVKERVQAGHQVKLAALSLFLEHF